MDSNGQPRASCVRGYSAPSHDTWDSHGQPRCQRTYRGIAIKTITRPREQRVLPLGIFWPGFGVNALFYAAILWLLILGPFALRRLIRQRRGLCPACGYDLRHGEHEACPECGVTA